MRALMLLAKVRQAMMPVMHDMRPLLRVGAAAVLYCALCKHPAANDALCGSTCTPHCILG